MTTADRVYARGRSLSYRGGPPPGTGHRHPSLPSQQQGRVAKLSQPGVSSQEDEYTTYAPRGEKCRTCGAEFRSLELVRRAPAGTLTGVPSVRPYVHIVCTGEGAS